MITVQVVGAEEVQARFLVGRDRVVARLREEINYLGMQLLRGVKENRLTGQSLNRRTGRLVRSINYQLKESPAAMSGSVGTNVVYGRFWELGFTGTAKVRAHQRVVSKIFGRSVDPRIVKVSAHDRKVNQKARPFLVPEFEAMREEIRKRLLSVPGVI